MEAQRGQGACSNPIAPRTPTALWLACWTKWDSQASGKKQFSDAAVSLGHRQFTLAGGGPDGSVSRGCEPMKGHSRGAEQQRALDLGGQGSHLFGTGPPVVHLLVIAAKPWLLMRCQVPC